jgi:hypothetical protein
MMCRYFFTEILLLSSPGDRELDDDVVQFIDLDEMIGRKNESFRSFVLVLGLPLTTPSHGGILRSFIP